MLTFTRCVVLFPAILYLGCSNPRARVDGMPDASVGTEQDSGQALPDAGVPDSLARDSPGPSADTADVSRAKEHAAEVGMPDVLHDASLPDTTSTVRLDSQAIYAAYDTAADTQSVFLRPDTPVPDSVTDSVAAVERPYDTSLYVAPDIGVDLAAPDMQTDTPIFLASDTPGVSVYADALLFEDTVPAETDVQRVWAGICGWPGPALLPSCVSLMGDLALTTGFNHTPCSNNLSCRLGPTSIAHASVCMAYVGNDPAVPLPGPCSISGAPINSDLYVCLPSCPTY